MGDLHHNPGSDESLALMKGWVDDCQLSHQACKVPQQVGRPKRLLQCLSDGSVRLETQSPTQHRDYIALSYSWGKAQTVQTTEETLGPHQRGISNESLPRLFREVAAIAHALNISYLWIDALCIIQDSDKDKEEEIIKMSDIYRGALVVLVAATTRSPLDSLLRVQPKSGQSHTWRTAGLIRCKEMDLDVKFRKRVWASHFRKDSIKSTPIGERAWSFQEKLLASRCLVFRHDEVVWECRSCCQCECGGEQEHLAEDYLLLRMKRFQKTLLPFAEHQLDGTLTYFADAEAAYRFWETAVVNYSARALTFETDRLPAISAVASTIAEATGDRYLAGLWRNDLLAGLAWIPSLSSPGLSSPGSGPHRECLGLHREYIAPTWSWASQSLPAGVGYSYPRSYWTKRNPDLDASVLEAWTALEGKNPYGPVSDAGIVLFGLHCDAKLTIPERGDAKLDFGHGDVQTVSLGLDFYKLDFMRVVPDANVDRLGGNARYLRRSDRQANKQPACSGTVCLLWLTEEISLILTPSRRREGAYERLGILDKFEHSKESLLGQIKVTGKLSLKSVKVPKTAQRSSVELV